MSSVKDHIRNMELARIRCANPAYANAILFLLNAKKEECNSEGEGTGSIGKEVPSIEFTAQECRCIKAILYYGLTEKVTESYKEDIKSINRKISYKFN